MSIYERLGSPGQQVAWDTRKVGLDLAAVTSIDDPEKRNRVKCKLLSDDKSVGETDWCPVASPFGAKEHGVFFHPNVKDIVLIAYLGGDVHRPYVIASVWTDEQAPPYKIENQKNEKYSIKTPQKSEMLFVDTKGKEVITITTPSGAVIAINDEKKFIELRDKGDKNHIKMQLDKGELEAVADKKITLKTGKASIVMTSDGTIKVDASTKVAINTGAFETKAKGKASINASGAGEFKASGALTLQASAVTTVKGSIVKIN